MISIQQAYILDLLVTEGPMTAPEIIRYMKLEDTFSHRQAIYTKLGKLERRGYVRRIDGTSPILWKAVL